MLPNPRASARPRAQVPTVPPSCAPSRWNVWPTGAMILLKRLKTRPPVASERQLMMKRRAGLYSACAEPAGTAVVAMVLVLRIAGPPARGRARLRSRDDTATAPSGGERRLLAPPSCPSGRRSPSTANFRNAHDHSFPPLPDGEAVGVTAGAMSSRRL